jgi:hypothetical protein
VTPARGDGSTKVPEVPGENRGVVRFAHCHHDRVREIDTRSTVRLQQVESTSVLAVRGAIEAVRPVQQRAAEDRAASR